jgi:hypothetical protein
MYINSNEDGLGMETNATEKCPTANSRVERIIAIQ